jgi:hypothetical protein
VSTIARTIIYGRQPTGEQLLTKLEDTIEEINGAAQQRASVVDNEIARLQQEREQLDQVKVKAAAVRGA